MVIFIQDRKSKERGRERETESLRKKVEITCNPHFQRYPLLELGFHVYVRWCCAEYIVFKNIVVCTAFFITVHHKHLFLTPPNILPQRGPTLSLAPFWWGRHPTVSQMKQGCYHSLWRQKSGRVAARRCYGAGGKPGRKLGVGGLRFRLSSALHSLWDLDCFPSSLNLSVITLKQTGLGRCGQGVWEFGLSYSGPCGLPEP